MKELIAIQSELEAPKGQFNAFGKYRYRSAEDILTALKPLLKKYECFINLRDEIKECGGRIYIESFVTIVNATGDSVTSTGYAREEETKKGMDGSQITGASSSYARKYALNGLFAIDDTKDIDATNDHGNPTPIAEPKPQAPQRKAAELPAIPPDRFEAAINKIMRGDELSYKAIKKAFTLTLDQLEQVEDAWTVSQMSTKQDEIQP